MTPAAIWWRYAERAMDLMKLYAKYPSVTAAAWFSIFLEQAETRLLLSTSFEVPRLRAI